MASSWNHWIPDIHKIGKPWNRAYGIVDDFDGSTGGEPSATDDAALWDLVGGSAAAAFTAGHGGLVRITENSTTQTGIATNVASIYPTAARRIYFEARLTLNDTSNISSCFIGLSNDTETPIGTSSGSTDYVGFFIVSAGAAWSYGSAKDKSGSATFGSGTTATTSASGETDAASSGTAHTQGTMQTFGFYLSNLKSVKFHIDGSHVGTVNRLQDTDGTYRNIADDGALKPMISFIGSGDTVDIDYIICVSDR
jgi:hypothetical protein